MKKQGTINRVIKIAAFGMAAVLAVGLVGGLIYRSKNPSEPPKIETPVKPGETQPGGAVLEKGEETGGIKLMSARLMSSEYEDYGVSPQAESAYTITATYTPADASAVKLDWTVTFKNASSTWATGKTVTDYVTVTPTADGALSAVVANKAAFGEQILVKASVRGNASATASCTVEYLQRTTGYTVVMDGKTFSTTGSDTQALTPDFSTTKTHTVNVTVNKSNVYTRVNTDKAEHYIIKPTSAFKTALTNAGISGGSTLASYTAAPTAFLDSAWCNALAGTSKKNALIDAMKAFSGAAYELEVYTQNGGTKLATFKITLDTSVIATQKVAENLTFDKSEIVF